MFEWLLLNNFTYIIHLLLIIGFIGTILTSIAKRFSLYAKFVVPLFCIMFLSGIFLEGFLIAKKDYINTLTELQKKLDIAEKKSNQVNEVIKTVYIDKVKVITEKGKENAVYIDKVVTKYDNICTLSNSAIRVHDGASQNELAQGTGGIDEGTSNVKISELLQTITENYTTYYKTREQVIGWQQWYNEQKKIFEGALQK
jgi:hypothetical protein